MKLSIKDLWREPLVHFLAAGALIFALDAALPRDQAEGNQIVVSLEQVEQLALLWERTWGRPPTDQELQGSVRDYIKNEVYYREALKLGLDVNDQVIRRRLRQKLEFFVVEESSGQAPSREVLEAWYEEHSQNYLVPAEYTFEQVYFAAIDEGRIGQALLQLGEGSDPKGIGDRISLPASMTSAPATAVSRTFGDTFAEQLSVTPTGEWSGPIRSGLGTHLVRLTAVTPARPLTFNEARPQVLRDWMADARVAAEEDAYARMRAQYDIRIEGTEE